jgi:hypothetical protein
MFFSNMTYNKHSHLPPYPNHWSTDLILLAPSTPCYTDDRILYTLRPLPLLPTVLDSRSISTRNL